MRYSRASPRCSWILARSRRLRTWPGWGKAVAALRKGLYELMVYFAAYTGLRWGELIALTSGQLNPAGRVVTVDRKIAEVRGQLYVEAPKNRKWRRTIYPRATPGGWPLAEMTAARIEEVKQEQAAGRNPLGLIFPAPKGGYWRSSNFSRRVLKAAYLTAGWRGTDETSWTWHSLRQLFCTTAFSIWHMDVAGHGCSRTRAKNLAGLYDLAPLPWTDVRRTLETQPDPGTRHRRTRPPRPPRIRPSGRPVAGRPGDTKAGEIARLCGYLPLAIGMLAAQLRHHPAWTAAGPAGCLPRGWLSAGRWPAAGRRGLGPSCPARRQGPMSRHRRDSCPGTRLMHSGD